MTWSLTNIKQLGELGVSAHIENDGDNNREKYQLFYTSSVRGGLAIDGLSSSWQLSQQGTINNVKDLTIVTLKDGTRRAYYVDLHEIYTALISDDGLILSDISSTGISNTNENKKTAWGVPDAVVLPDGRTRLYWVNDDTGFDTLADEFIVSATSTSSEGISFSVDEGKRVENGYVDFEVLQAKDNDWIAIMSSSPETVPAKSQGIYMGTSNDGLNWTINENNLAPTNLSYMDPTGILFSNSENKWKIIMSESELVLGDKDYSLVSADLILSIDKKNYSGNSFDYKFYNLGDNEYGIKPDIGGSIDLLTGISNVQFNDKKLNIANDIKGVFDQVTGLNTDSGEMFRLYNAAFARFPDSSGLKYWINQYSSGVDDSRAVASSFLVSDEFSERYGTNVTNAKYVETLYINVLGRDYDQEGYNYWLGNLNNGTETRYELLLGFSESAENKSLFTDMTGLG